jgi:ubiquinone/menaquinone biosynthesis C-methylase UbiE
MLDECRKKAEALGVSDRCRVVQADVFEHEFLERAYDCVLVGFLLSHLTEDQERFVFERLGRMLDVSGRFLVLDSAWTPERARFNAKIERQERRLNDGSRFEIYKRYVDRNDIHQWATKYGVVTSIEHFGTAFIAVSGSFGA